MSTGVTTDLQALIDFRSHLVDFHQKMTDEFSSVRSHWATLGEVWRDDKYRELGEALEEAGKGIEHYLARREDYEGHLAQLIQALTDFLNTRRY